MPARELFHKDSYLQTCSATVTASDDGAFTVDQTVFYPLGGGQPGDTGCVEWDDRRLDVIDARYGQDRDIAHHVAEGDTPPAVGTTVTMTIDWDRRYRHMRMHTAMHLLGSILKFDVTGGNISTEKSRLDFNMEEIVDTAAGPKERLCGSAQH